MKKVNIEFMFPLISLFISIIALSTDIFGLPPLGKFLDPFIGVVQNEKNVLGKDKIRLIEINTPHLPVSVFFDERSVPHIFAKNADDLYFSQGYVTAYFRLWQMDFLTYTSAGRLSEIFSDGFVDYDRNQRRIGILASAKASLELMEKDPETNRVLGAYTMGVNAYIKSLRYKDLPVEYKMLNYTPEPWTKLKSVLIMKYMANTLSGYDEDVNITNLMLTLGEQNFNKYFPAMGRYVTPMVTGKTGVINQSLIYTKQPAYLDFSFLNSNTRIPKNTYNPKLGSNSWVVSGKKTKSGFPILATDPHLSFSLPSIWLEMQLEAPGINVYGVSIPGTPAVIIGFNKNIAWGITNGADDVKNWYKLQISSDYKRYKYDEKWIDLKFDIEEIKRKGYKTINDTVYKTNYGPIVNDQHFPGANPELVDYALSWELHKPSNEILTFIKLSSAQNYDDYRNALSSYSCPIQNFTFASKDNTIAVTHQGKMPENPPGYGKFLLDGTKEIKNVKYIPNDSLPSTKNPSDNYIVSANQHPTDALYKYYYNGYFSETRANQIDYRLKNKNDFNISDMKSIQLDNSSSFAKKVLPILFKVMMNKKLNARGHSILKNLASWNGSFDLKDENAGFYFLWWKNIKDYTWDEFHQFKFYSRYPDDYVLFDLIKNEPDNIYFDQLNTTRKENSSDIVYDAFVAALNDYIMAKDDIKWGDHNKVNFGHPLRLNELSRKGIPSGGFPDAINAVSNSWGPSWRMIVELGDRPKAVGIYPGGQSGNPGDRDYDQFIGDWNKGIYYTLNYYLSPSEAKQKTHVLWSLTK